MVRRGVVVVSGGGGGGVGGGGDSSGGRVKLIIIFSCEGEEGNRRKVPWQQVKDGVCCVGLSGFFGFIIKTCR